MKQIILLLSGCLSFCFGFAQTESLSITTGKTTSLIFPFAIRHVDRGTKDILIQPLKEANNILLLKAGSKDFAETNLSVVTNDGKLYSFTVNYEKDPSCTVYHFENKGTIATYANGILDNVPTMRGIRNHKWDIHAGVTGIYIKDNVIYYQLQICNCSSIDYDIDNLRFYIRDKKKGRRTAIQEIECRPVYTAGNAKQVKAYSRNVLVVALEKFTIPDAKFLAIEIMERNGGRHLRLKVKNSQIIRARPLPDLN